MWEDYIRRLCPSAKKVHQLLREEQALINDHIALRTFAAGPLGLATLAQPFLDLGYIACGDYHFEYPDPEQPKVFISQLDVELCSAELQAIVDKLVQQVDNDELGSSRFLYGGRLWDIEYQDYLALAQESEYAAWLAAHGYGANHFTVSVNQLNAFNEVAEVNAHLRDNGFLINEFGGAVKGSPEVLLEQSSTMADKVHVDFADGQQLIPGGFYEFAKRYPLPDGSLYQGFVAASADKIFESTDN
jgi:hypothetical protein